MLLCDTPPPPCTTHTRARTHIHHAAPPPATNHLRTTSLPQSPPPHKHTADQHRPTLLWACAERPRKLLDDARLRTRALSTRRLIPNAPLIQISPGPQHPGRSKAQRNNAIDTSCSVQPPPRSESASRRRRSGDEDSDSLQFPYCITMHETKDHHSDPPVRRRACVPLVTSAVHCVSRPRGNLIIVPSCARVRSQSDQQSVCPEPDAC